MGNIMAIVVIVIVEDSSRSLLVFLDSFGD